MQNGKTLHDTDSHVLHAHGGFMLRENGWFYWFGENRTGEIRVSCYRSRDLETWEFCRHVLTLSSQTREHYVRTERLLTKAVMTQDGHQRLVGCNLERPKVIYCKKTGKYVM